MHGEAYIPGGGAYIRNSLSVIEYGGPIHGGAYILGGDVFGGRFSVSYLHLSKLVSLNLIQVSFLHSDASGCVITHAAWCGRSVRGLRHIQERQPHEACPRYGPGGHIL